MYSITMKWTSPSLPTESVRARLGCEQRRERSISRRNRAQRVLFLEGLAGREHLDRDLLAPVVHGQVDLAHAPFAQGAEEAITAQEEAAGLAREELPGLDRS